MKRSRPIPSFCWMNWGKPRKTSVRKVCLDRGSGRVPSSNYAVTAVSSSFRIHSSLIAWVTVKVKLSLWLIKHYAMNTFGNLGIRWRWVVGFTLYPPWKRPRYPLDKEAGRAPAGNRTPAAQPSLIQLSYSASLAWLPVNKWINKGPQFLIADFFRK
jgi:hypothetical protein